MVVKTKYDIGEKVDIQTVDDNGIVCYECELDLMNPRKELSMSEFDELFDMQNILQRLESKLSEDKSLTNIDKCKIHDAWVAVKSMEEYLNLENYKEK